MISNNNNEKQKMLLAIVPGIHEPGKILQYYTTDFITDSLDNFTARTLPHL